MGNITFQIPQITSPYQSFYFPEASSHHHQLQQGQAFCNFRDNLEALTVTLGCEGPGISPSSATTQYFYSL